MDPKPLPSIPNKRYFTIGETSVLCGVKAYVLRYWEQEFTQLKPMKRRGNRRYYQHGEVLLIRRIRALLYDEGFTISGARNRLAEEIATARRAPAGAVGEGDAGEAGDGDDERGGDDVAGDGTRPEAAADERAGGDGDIHGDGAIAGATGSTVDPATDAPGRGRDRTPLSLRRLPAPSPLAPLSPASSESPQSPQSPRPASPMATPQPTDGTGTAAAATATDAGAADASAAGAVASPAAARAPWRDTLLVRAAAWAAHAPSYAPAAASSVAPMPRPGAVPLDAAGLLAELLSIREILSP